jgi:hypothetical protein
MQVSSNALTKLDSRSPITTFEDKFHGNDGEEAKTKNNMLQFLLKGSYLLFHKVITDPRQRAASLLSIRKIPPPS